MEQGWNKGKSIPQPQLRTTYCHITNEKAMQSCNIKWPFIVRKWLFFKTCSSSASALPLTSGSNCGRFRLQLIHIVLPKAPVAHISSLLLSQHQSVSQGNKPLSPRIENNNISVRPSMKYSNMYDIQYLTFLVESCLA